MIRGRSSRFFRTMLTPPIRRIRANPGTAAEGVAPQNYRVSGDVSTTYDNQAMAFICYIAFDKLGTFKLWAHNASRNRYFVAALARRRQAWSRNCAVSEYATNPAIPFEDKPYIVADTTKSRYAWEPLRRLEPGGR